MKNENTKNEVTKLHSLIPAEFPHIRILDAEERALFSTEAWGEINNYLSLGVINTDQFEFIIVKLLEIGIQNIDLENLRSIVDSVIIMQSTKASSLANVVFTPRDLIN